MKISYQIFLLLGLFIYSSLSFAAIQSKEVSYQVNGTELTGFMAWNDAQQGKRPGVLVVHEWWGHNDYARKRAQDLAKEGYVGFALDMYGDKKLAEHPQDANKFMTEVMSRAEEMLARFNAGKAQLKASELVDSENIAAIGYCFGGAVVLNVARGDSDLAGVVSFHGNLDPLKKDNSPISTPILVLNGADDPFVKAESIENFKAEMKKRGADYKFVNYKGAKHSFTNPGATAVGEKFELPLEYNAKVDKKSWKAMKAFLKKQFRASSSLENPARAIKRY
jgi:dienelactone hydrolase